MKHSKILVGAALVVALSSFYFLVGRAAETTPAEMHAIQDLQGILLKPGVSANEVSNLLHRIAPTNTPAEALARISNSQQFPEKLRRSCFCRLARMLGHYPNKPLSEVARFLGNPLWIREQDVSEVVVLTGSIPVEDDPKGTVIMITVFPDSGRKDSAIYFQFRDTVRPDAFYRILRGQSHGDFPDPVVNEIGVIQEGVSDPNPQALERWLKNHPQVKQTGK